MVNQNRQKQIESRQSLADLSKTVEFITNKFDKSEKEHDEKNKIIKELNDKVSVLTKRTKGVEESIDHQGQYSRQNCLLIHGVEENSSEVTDKLVFNVINNDLEIGLTEVAIHCTHHIRDPKKEEEGWSYYCKNFQAL